MKMTKNYKKAVLAKPAIRDLAKDFSWEIVGSEMLSFMGGAEARKFFEYFIAKEYAKESISS
jgi:hypothetical protein